MKARAKINLSLEILGKRPDNYHNLKSVFQKINLYDEIYVEKDESNECEIQTNIGNLDSKDNIIYKAYVKLKEIYPQITGVKVNLNKRIPMEAGMAGGSTDCASFILCINKLFSLNMSKEERESIGKSLGADVVPCFYNRALLAEGIGEIITLINTNFKYYIVIIKPQISCSTKEMFKKIEVYYLANEDKNIFFTLLGDCTTSEREVEKEDKKIIESGKEEAEKLNQKYNQNNKFNFLYRKRIWNPKETCYMGWERKRGLLIEFNRSILKQTKETFLVNTLENFSEKIKYVITLDSDTNLIIDSAQKMVGAMSHILNKPVIEDKIVTEGYGIMQPRIGISLEDSKKTIYTKIFSTTPGIDFYTNNISDIYQDCFKEGIYTGKGIYDLEVYQKIIEKRFPENRILSHDLIEGSYLRCGLLTDVVLLDTFPKRYLSSLEREHRWIRGDWQIATWSENKKINGGK